MERDIPNNICWCQRTRVISLSCGIKISAVCSFLSLQSTRVTDGRTDRQNYDTKIAPAYASSGEMINVVIYFTSPTSKKFETKCDKKYHICKKQRHIKNKSNKNYLQENIFKKNGVQTVHTSTKYATEKRRKSNFNNVNYKTTLHMTK